MNGMVGGDDAGKNVLLSSMAYNENTGTSFQRPQ